MKTFFTDVTVTHSSIMLVVSGMCHHEKRTRISLLFASRSVCEARLSGITPPTLLKSPSAGLCADDLIKMVMEMSRECQVIAALNYTNTFASLQALELIADQTKSDCQQLYLIHL